MSAVPSWAVRGRKVICITDDWRREAGVVPIDPPVKGRTYTIVRVHHGLFGPIILELEELPFGVGADIGGFRPAVSLDDDMATHFDAILHLHDFHPEPV